MPEVTLSHIEAFDGTPLAVHRMGKGRPVLLLHGLFSSAQMNWIQFGHAQKLADAGFEAIMPDHRAHGESGHPHDPACYPPNVLLRDAMTVVETLGLDDFDLVGFSLGARTATRCVIAGLEPRRLALCGMGLEGLAAWDRRGGFFIRAIDRFDEIKAGDEAFFAKQFMKSMKVDLVATRLLLESVDDIHAHELAHIGIPTAVICGDKDRDNGSPHELVEALPDAVYYEVPGTHMGCVTKPELGRAIASFLSD